MVCDTEHQVEILVDDRFLYLFRTALVKTVLSVRFEILVDDMLSAKLFFAEMTDEHLSLLKELPPLLIAFFAIRRPASFAVNPRMSTNKLLKKRKTTPKEDCLHVNLIVMNSYFRGYVHVSILAYYNTFVNLFDSPISNNYSDNYCYRCSNPQEPFTEGGNCCCYFNCRRSLNF